MEPLYFELDFGLPVTILPKGQDGHDNGTRMFQLYYSGPDQEGKSLCDLNNYFGLVSFDPANQQFYYSPGSRTISSDDILQIIDCINIKILNL